MLGIVIGTLCLLALIGTLRHRHFHRFGYYGHGGHTGCERRGGHGGGLRGFGMRRLRHVLDLTDAQTDALRDVQLAIHTARDRAADRVDSSRKTLADALSADTFDAQSAGHAFDAVLQSLDESRAALVTALGHAHQALTPEQRKRIARFITL